jgi:DNA-binding response OmpR family regulator
MSTVPVTTPDTRAAGLVDNISQIAAHAQRVSRHDSDPAVSAAVMAAGAALAAAAARLTADLAQLAREPEQRAALTPDMTPLRVGELHIDRSAQTVRLAGKAIDVSRKEYALLCVMATDPDRLFTKAELYRSVWDANLAALRTRTLDSHISRLRIKLGGAPWVENVWGTGYRLRPASPRLAPVAL